MNHRLFILKFFAAVFLIGILSPSLTAFSQSSSPKSVQMDWEEIRDAQVQMLRKKEAELDRMKEELLTRAQPQAQIQSGLPEVEAEFKKQEAEWLQKSDRYENEITLLKVKIDEQKKEIELLRSQLSETLKKNQPGQQGKSDAQDLTRRELLIQIQKKELQDKQAEWESQKKQYQKVKGELARLGKEKIDFQNQAATWEASKLQVEQMHEAEKLQLQTDRQALEIQKEIFVKDKAGLAVETNNFQAKFKELQAASAQAQELVKRETVISSKEQQLSQKQASLDMREKGFRDSQNQIASWEASKLQVDQKQKAEQLQIETERRDFQTQKAALEKDRAALAVEKEVLHRQSEKLQDLSVQAKEITNHEVAVAAREQQWVQKQTELNEREKSIANVLV